MLSIMSQLLILTLIYQELSQKVGLKAVQTSRASCRMLSPMYSRFPWMASADITPGKPACPLTLPELHLWLTVKH